MLCTKIYEQRSGGFGYPSLHNFRRENGSCRSTFDRIVNGTMTKIGGKEDIYKIKLHKKIRCDRMLNSDLLHEIADHIVGEV